MLTFSAVTASRHVSTNLNNLVPLPPKGSYNTGLTACKPSTLKELLGEPRETYGPECRPVTNPKLKARIVTKSVGPFRVTGLDVAVASLARVLDAIKRHDPDAYAQIGSAGMLCARLVRGSKKSVSNHAWGTAIDLTFGDEVDPRGDGKCQLGLLRVYKHFHAEGWYWGAGFPTEDAMHFELADETVRKLG
ncbi:MAG: M15 family metallopeptidase [Armatimonadetes bacterium]|nr:M15 family metallopeptidase [Armatimonadota bacterium]